MLSHLKLAQVILNPDINNANFMQLASESMNFRREVSLVFEYSDIKHIVIQQ